MTQTNLTLLITQSQIKIHIHVLLQANIIIIKPCRIILSPMYTKVIKTLHFFNYFLKPNFEYLSHQSHVISFPFDLKTKNKQKWVWDVVFLVKKMFGSKAKIQISFKNTFRAKCEIATFDPKIFSTKMTTPHAHFYLSLVLNGTERKRHHSDEINIQPRAQCFKLLTAVIYDFSQ